MTGKQMGAARWIFHLAVRHLPLRLAVAHFPYAKPPISVCTHGHYHIYPQGD